MLPLKVAFYCQVGGEVFRGVYALVSFISISDDDFTACMQALEGF
jgi:hypothetical protein